MCVTALKESNRKVRMKLAVFLQLSLILTVEITIGEMKETVMQQAGHCSTECVLEEEREKQS